MLKCSWVQNEETGNKAHEKEKCVSAQIVVHGGRRSVRRKAPTIDVQPTGDIEGNSPKENYEKRIRHKDRTGKPEIQNEEKAQQQFQPRKDDGGDMDHCLREDAIIVDDFRKSRRVQDLVDACVEENNAEENSQHDDQYPWNGRW